MSLLARRLQTDIKKSFGNYLVAKDGTSYLDFFPQISSSPLGYNHHKLTKRMTDKMPDIISLMINRPVSCLFSDKSYNYLIHDFVKNAPPNMNNVEIFGTDCSIAIDEAIKTVCLWKFKQKHDEMFIYKLEKEIYKDRYAGISDMEILSFVNGFHGTTGYSNSCTHTKPLYKTGVPAFKWPYSDFPKLKYPLGVYEYHNKFNEKDCLDDMEQKLTKNKNIAGVIVEPIQVDGGDNHANHSFFSGIRKLTTKYNVAMIVDEVQTGGGCTGKFWAHEHWNLDDSPDIVVFAKKLQVGGYYYKPEFAPSFLYQNSIDNTKLILSNEIMKIIEEDKLLENVIDQGNKLMKDLMYVQKNTEMIKNIRGQGLFISFDGIESRISDCIETKLEKNKIIVGRCGDQQGIRLRPALILGDKERELFINTLFDICVVLRNYL